MIGALLGLSAVYMVVQARADNACEKAKASCGPGQVCAINCDSSPLLRNDSPSIFLTDKYGYIIHQDLRKRCEEIEKQGVIADFCTALFLKDIRDILKEKK